MVLRRASPPIVITLRSLDGHAHFAVSSQRHPQCPLWLLPLSSCWAHSSFECHRDTSTCAKTFGVHTSYEHSGSHRGHHPAATGMHCLLRQGASSRLLRVLSAQPWNVPTLECSDPGIFRPWNVPTLECSDPGSDPGMFRPRRPTVRYHPLDLPKSGVWCGVAAAASVWA